MTRIATIIGARPQFIKAAVVSRALCEGHPGTEEFIIHTGQHYDANMSDVFFDDLGIPRPSHHLGIGGGSHGQNTGRMLEAVEQVLFELRPDWVLVYGDTDSTLAGALAAAKIEVPVAHVEAGLRSFNRRMPEELNRVLTDHISSRLFTPSSQADENLAAEGINGERISRVGDVMFDAALYYRATARRPRGANFDEPFVLATLHRAENTDDPERLKAIVSALARIAEQQTVVLPLHPRTRKKIVAQKLQLGKIQVLEPLGYLEMIWLLEHCSTVMTDSGGLQKEAYYFHKPCITMRDETEWGELLEIGWNRLASVTEANLLRVYEQVRESQLPTSAPPLYGDGSAGRRIAGFLAGTGSEFHHLACSADSDGPCKTE